MQQQFSILTNKIIAIMLLVVSIPVFIVGIGGVMSYPHEAWKVGVALLVSTALLWYGAIASWRKAKQQQASNNETEKYISQNIATLNTTITPSNENITHIKFMYTVDEWKAFVKWEKTERRLNTFIEACWVTILGAVVLNLTRGPGWFISFLFAGGVAAIYYFLKVLLTNAYLKRTANEYYAVVTANSIIINGKEHPINDGHRRAGKLKLIANANPQVLEFTYHWNTRRGSTYDEVRIPVPHAQLASAKALVEIWNKQINTK